MGWNGSRGLVEDDRRTFREIVVVPTGLPRVEFTDGPNEQPYGIDAGFRDPFR